MNILLKQLFSLILISLNYKHFNAQNGDLTNYSLRIVNVDWNKAYFEIVDDKKTTFNYDLSYTLTSHDSIMGDSTIKSHLFLQTNPISLIEKEEKIEKNDNFKPDQNMDPNGEYYNEWQKNYIRKKNYTDVHVFHIDDLEPNRSYMIMFKTNRTRAHLSLSLLPDQNISSQSNIETFSFKFKTLFDPKLIGSITCSNSSTLNTNLSSFLSCYVEKSGCTQCKPHCYKVPRYDKPVLCWPCPCDLSRSNGICSVEKGENFEPEKIKCEKCKAPYTGPMCDQCQNEGFDYYKNDLGQCIKCNCNNNSYFDSFRMINNSELRKCNSNGYCHSCLYNTSGKHCDECAMGFEGDALKRTCRPVGKTTKMMENPVNHQHAYKTLALFSFYIFLVLFVILAIFFCIKIKLESTSLKNDQNQLLSWFSGSLVILQRTRDRIGTYLQNSRLFGLFSLNNSTNSNSIYNRARLNDDDRLNLAEHPVFDDNLLDDAFVYNPNDDFDANRSKNPYTSLTVKT